jgi:serine/threonine-protein kinase
MSNQARVQQLVDEVLDTERTPEEVCADCPELLEEVRKRSQEMLRRVEAEVQAMFPTPRPEREGDTPPPWNSDTGLPCIPGYQVEAVLGRGGMGIVYKAWHLRLNRPVALKMLLAGAYAGPQERERFLREAEVVAGLRHPNLVQVYDIGDHEGRPYFTMEYVEGGSLTQRLMGTPQCVRHAAGWVAVLAEAVHIAHQGGIIHRDLKPANILLQRKPGITMTESPVDNVRSANIAPAPHSDSDCRISDFDPKIADFGLARHFDRDSGLTLSGARVGTPSYMAPEQALGKTRGIGPSVDIYALGAVLYELLTGRPPFRGATATETQLQVVQHEPVPPSRLNPRVPRDLETICLKCLSKDPERRYTSALALADDLRRFQEGRPILARPAGWAERSWRWVRRNPTAAALLATALALVGLASGGGVWLVQQQAERRAEAIRHADELRNDVHTAVTQAASLRQGFHFREARALLEQVRERLEPAGPDDLRGQVNQAWAELVLAEKLDKARLRAATLVDALYDYKGAQRLYAEAFAEAGLGQPGDDMAALAARVRQSPLRAELIAALDDWASVTPDERRWVWMFAVACEADRNAARNRLRQPELWKGLERSKDPEKLRQLTQGLNRAEFSPQLVIALSRVARANGAESVAEALLTEAQVRLPQDFWLNHQLGDLYSQARKWDKALGYFRAALALRPDVPTAYNGVAGALRDLGQFDESVRTLRKALQLDPSDYTTRHNFAMALGSTGQVDDMIRELQQAIRLKPDSAGAHVNLGMALARKGRKTEAIQHGRVAIQLDPKSSAGAHVFLGTMLLETGKTDEAIDYLSAALKLDPKLAIAHSYLGSAFRAKGNKDKVIHHAQQALAIEPNAAVYLNNLARALHDKGRLEEAIDHFQRAVLLEPKAPVSRSNLGVSLYVAACSALQAATGPGSGKAPLGEPEKSSLRRKALNWLRANLKLSAELRNEGITAGWSVVSWRTDPALARVRDPAELVKLPDAERAQWQRFWTDVSAFIAADPLEQGRAFAARRDWAQAARCYARARRGGPVIDGHFLFEYAALLLLSGDRPGYVKTCADLIEKCGKNEGLRSYHVARACTLAPDAVADAALPGRLAQTELQASAKQFWSLTEQGALAYRTGRFQESVPLFEQSLRAYPRPGVAVVNWLWLALANQRLGNAEEAQRWLGKAQTWLDQYRDGMPARAEQELGLHLHNWLEAHVLRREAEALIQPPDSGSSTKNRGRGTP